MIKTFCDVCEAELTEKNSLPRGHELKGDGKVLRVAAHVSLTLTRRIRMIPYTSTNI